MARRSRIRRRTAKRRTTRKVRRVAPVVVKRALLRLSETKHKYFTISGGMLDNIAYFENLNYWIGQGTGDQNRIGDKIFVKTITMKFNILDIPAQVGDSDMKVKIWIMKARDAVKNGTLAPALGVWAGPSISKQGANLTQCLLDTERFTWVKTKTIIIPYCQITNTPRWKQFTIRLKVNANWHYDGDNSGYLKTNQLFLMAAVQSVGSSSTFNSMTLSADCDVAFKDI